MKVLGYRPLEFKTVRAQAFGSGDPVKIKINRSLLNPMGKDIAATLHFNGTTVYIPKDAIITIGSSPKCDIRIKDPSIGNHHLMITSFAGDVNISHLHPEKITAIGDSTMPQPKVLSSEEEYTLQNDSKIALELSGTNRSLIMDIRLKKATDEALKTALAQQLTVKPQIEQVSPSKALQRIEEKPGALITDSAPIDRGLVGNTSFRLARTYDELFNIYLAEIERLENKEKDIKTSTFIAGAISGWGTMASTFAFTSTHHQISLFFIGMGGLGFLTSCAVAAFDSTWKQINKLTKDLKDILYHSDNIDKVAEELRKLPPHERAKILKNISESDSMFATALKYAVKNQKLVLTQGASELPALPPANDAAKQGQKT